MARMIKWDRQDGGSYAWPLGLHYYAEPDEGEWFPCLMIGNEDYETWEGVETREEAEVIMQADFNKRLAEWAPEHFEMAAEMPLFTTTNKPTEAQEGVNHDQ